MKKTLYLVLMVLFVIAESACAKVLPEPVKEKIEPGDKIDGMTVDEGSLILPYPLIWQFCDYMSAEQQPFSSKTRCSVPQMSGLDIGFGWIAKESKFLSNWDSLTWALSIDGYPVDLEKFEWYESYYPIHGEPNKSRQWFISLIDYAPGKHKLRLSWTFKSAVDDGINIYQPGTYTHEVNFTVLEKMGYPALSSTPEVGQHTYTSPKAGLDFLLYLPDDYGKDPQQQWPLIVYLHGVLLRGATLDLLRQEALPQKLEKEENFPFLVVSPLGDGGYEFWAKDEMISPLFMLLEEIQAVYSINPKRIYLTGNDMGGNGVWAIGLSHPEYFAALVPVGGYLGYPFKVPQNICELKDVPVWAFHGGQDTVVPVEVEKGLVDALSDCGGNARITVKPDMRNVIPNAVFSDPELYQWLLSNSRE